MGFLNKLFGQSTKTEQQPNSESFITEQQLIEKYGGTVLHKQLDFGDLIGENNWNINIEDQEISFGDDLVFSNSGIGYFFAFFGNLALVLGKFEIRTFR